jgi:hypothetical protein
VAYGHSAGLIILECVLVASGMQWGYLAGAVILHAYSSPGKIRSYRACQSARPRLGGA